MKLNTLMREFIDNANRSMSFGSLPVAPKETETPIIATNRWQSTEEGLTKTYEFRRSLDRDSFVMAVLAYEQQVGHHATIVIRNDSVTIRIMTENTTKPTELDKEYACYSDILFRDLVNRPDT